MTVGFTTHQADISIETAALAQRAQKNIGLTWGISHLDQHGTPPLAGWVYTFAGRSGNMKSTLMAHFNRHFGNCLIAANASDPDHLHVGVWVKVEEMIEQARFGIWEGVGLHYADLFNPAIPIATITNIRKNQAKPPILYVGKSATGTKYTSATAALDNARVSTAHIADFIAALKNGDFYTDGTKQIKIAYVVVDYLQKLEPRTKGRYTVPEKVEAVSNDILDIASALSVPIILAAQTQMKENDGGIPDETEIFGSSQAGMDTFAFVGMMRPSKSKNITMSTNIRTVPPPAASSWDGDSFKIKGDPYCYPITNDFAVLRVGKWRNTKKLEGKTFPVWFDNESHVSEVCPYGIKPAK